MKEIIKKIGTGLAVVASVALLASASFTPAMAADCDPESGITGGKNCAQGTDTQTELFGDGGIVTTVINTMLFIVGILAVVMIIYGFYQRGLHGSFMNGTDFRRYVLHFFQKPVEPVFYNILRHLLFHHSGRRAGTF